MRGQGGKAGGQTLSESSRDVADGAAPTPGRQSLVQLSVAPADVAPGRAASAEQPAPGPTPQLPHYSSIQRIFANRVQAKATAGPGAPDVHAAAAQGISGPAGQLPHLAQIQRSFGKHDVSHIQAHVGGAAEAGARAMGAEAFATGDHVAFAGALSLHIAAHEAAHVVQQRGGVQLAGGVGTVGDTYEQHADAVADKVVRGESAEALLDQHAGGGAGAFPGVQRTEAAPRAGGSSAAALVDEAIQVVETALALATGEIEDGAASAPSATSGAHGDGMADTTPSSGSRGRPDTVVHLQAALTGLAALHGAADDAIRTAVTPILRQVGAPSVTDASTPAAAPVQRNTLVVGAPLLAGGPPGWVAYAVLGIASVGIMGYAAYQAAQSRARSRDRADPRVDPRVIPRTTSPQHRGRIQVQGGGLELSFPWTRSVPMTKAEGLAGLASLQGMLSRGQLAVRDQAFVAAAKFIEATLYTCPPRLARTFQNSAIRDRDGNERVDIEIHAGVAFA